MRYSVSMHPKLILLNGTTSSGKSSIVKCLREKLSAPYLEMGLDKFLYMLPDQYLKQPLWGQVWGHSKCAGDIGNKLMSGMHQSWKTLIGSGNLVIADHVLIEKNWAQELAELFHDQQAYFIGVHCPLEVAEKREADRKDRTLGSAREQYSIVHQWAEYDLTLDSSITTPEQSAEMIVEFLKSPPPPMGFAKTREKILS